MVLATGTTYFGDNFRKAACGPVAKMGFLKP